MQTDEGIPIHYQAYGDVTDAKYWVNNNGQIFYEARDEYDITTIQHYLCGYDTEKEAIERVMRQTFYVNAYERGRAYGGPEEGGVRYAYMDGYLPELDPNKTDKSLDELITDAINVETDPQKKMMLINSWSLEAYEQWSKNRQKELI